VVCTERAGVEALLLSQKRGSLRGHDGGNLKREEIVFVAGEGAVQSERVCSRKLCSLKYTHFHMVGCARSKNPVQMHVASTIAKGSAQQSTRVEGDAIRALALSHGWSF
jgi:hypothetical protein